MKKQLTLIVAMVLLAAGAATAQDVKIGYTNFDLLVSKLPNYPVITQELEDYQAQLRAQAESKYNELQQKFADYEQKAATMIPEVRKDKEQELQTLQENLEKFQQTAEQSMTRKRAELLLPAYEKVEKAVYAVAEAKGFTHILNTQAGGGQVLLYGLDQDDVTRDVLAQLNIEVGPDENVDALQPIDLEVLQEIGTTTQE